MYYSLSPSFHRSHLIFRSNVQDFSSYASALKTLPLKNKCKKNKEMISEEGKIMEKLSKLMKISNSVNTKKKAVLPLVVSRRTIRTKSKCSYNFDSTKSYDPNLLVHNLEVDRYFEKCGRVKTLKSTQSTSLLGPEVSGDKLTDRAKQSYKNLSSKNIKEWPSGVIKLKSNLLQKNANVRKEDISRCLETNKNELSNSLKTTNSVKEFVKYQSEDNILPSQLRLNEDVMKTKDLNFKYFSESVTSHHKFVYQLLSSVDIYVTNNSVLKGYALVDYSRKRGFWTTVIEKEAKNVLDVYNLLLNGLSEKGFWDLMQTVTKWMALDNIKLDHESFAALLYCLAKRKEFENDHLVMDEVIKTINQLFVNNVSLDDIFSKAVLSKERAEKILALVQEAVPSFDIQPVTINLSSDCPLTQNLLLVNNGLESPVGKMDLETMKNLVEEQLHLENKYMIEVKSVSRPNSVPFFNEYKKKISDLKKEWRKSLEKALQSTSKLSLNNYQGQNLHVYLNSIPQEEMLDILMEMVSSLLEFSSGFSPNIAQFSVLLSNKVAHRYQVRKKILNKNAERTEELFNHYLSWYLDPHGPARNSRQKWQMLIQINDTMCQLDSKVYSWPYQIKMSLGKFLLNLIISELKFSSIKNGEKQYFPVFYTVLRFRSGHWREEIKCHPNISNLFQKLGFETLTFQADQMPMVCPPKPWKSVNHGGYLLLPSDFLRKPSVASGKVLKPENIPLKNVYPTMDGLNALQAIPWTINENVLDVALEVFQNGGSEELSVPPFPKPVKFEESLSENPTYQERMNAQFLRKKMLQKKFEDYGLWVEALYRLSLANHFRKRLFWLPQNCDFRGRVYPVPALLNHIGADLHRSLLLFGKGKPLGHNGLDWLKIHLINLTGTRKRQSILERLAYANEILPLILNSAEKPLKGCRWWMESEKPWQTLAACMEIKKALSVSNPENYVCHFPVHQDGSCNGLQHYAALGKDLIGAQSVNLLTMDSPQDVYSVIAKLIEEERAKDEEKGLEVAIKLRGLIERRVVKQTVMTTVYGVTMYGAKLQIGKRLEEIPNFPEEYVRPAAAYLADKTFFCLKKMFTSAREIQEWFVKCADTITSFKDYVQWMTPLGLPVLQPYGKFRSNDVEPDKLKQKNAFPPNFIHSLDSTHMILTALFCEQAGVSFAAVHDCFWTHPNSVDIMNKICREQFISLHSQPLLENLSQFFIRQYLQNSCKDENISNIFQSVPLKGSFNLNEVKNSVYFFS